MHRMMWLARTAMMCAGLTSSTSAQGQKPSKEQGARAQALRAKHVPLAVGLEASDETHSWNPQRFPGDAGPRSNPQHRERRQFS